MHRPNIITPAHTLRSFLVELATYVSLLTPLLGVLIAWYGLSESNYIFFLYAVLPCAIGLGWLIAQYRQTKIRMAEEGVVQRPAWFWRLITNKVPHKSEQLTDSQVMVFVPPNKEAEAQQLADEYNRGGNHILLFHFIPEAHDAQIDEDRGTISPGGDVRSLATLEEEMSECAALVLLDDTKWASYEGTASLIEAWTKSHTVRPVMSVHLGGRGTLNYSWNRLEDLVGNNALKNRLLAQSANRGARWFWQARLYRRIILVSLAFAFVLSLTTVLTAYTWQRNARIAAKNTAALNDRLNDSVATFNKITSSEMTGQQDISRAFQAYRTSINVSESQRLRLLLKVHADQIVKTLVAASRQVEAISGNAIMFSVRGVDDHHWTIQEVAATRIPPNSLAFSAEVNSSGGTTDIKGVVTCAVLSHAFVLWSGSWNGNKVGTDNMQAWDLKGEPIGYFADDKLNIDNYRCQYEKRPTEDVHRRILCAPIGIELHSDKTSAAGAICITYTQDVGFLHEPWVRQTIARYGSSLSFVTWDKATVDSDDYRAEPTRTPKPLRPRKNYGRPRRNRTR